MSSRYVVKEAEAEPGRQRVFDALKDAYIRGELTTPQ